MQNIQGNLCLVLDRIKEHILNDPEDAELWAERIEDMLDDLHSNDFFGTEGQFDPRGDFRDDDWSVFGNVQEFL